MQESSLFILDAISMIEVPKRLGILPYSFNTDDGRLSSHWPALPYLA